MFGLNEEVLNKIIMTIESVCKVEEIVLYGSRAKGNYKPNSDVDITLKGNNITQNNLNKISNSLDDLLYPFKIDLSIFNNIDNPELIGHINRIGKKL